MRSQLAQGLAVGALVLAGYVSQGCVAPRRVYVHAGPPAPVVEARVVAPGPDYLWVAGYYRWAGGQYAWVPGTWARPPRPRAVWVAPRWEHGRRGWYQVPGHWDNGRGR